MPVPLPELCLRFTPLDELSEAPKLYLALMASTMALIRSESASPFARRSEGARLLTGTCMTDPAIGSGAGAAAAYDAEARAMAAIEGSIIVLSSSQQVRRKKEDKSNELEVKGRDKQGTGPAQASMKK